MAEFVDVLRQFDRMCKVNNGCINCPLHEPDGVSDRCSIGAFINDSKRIEREIMCWAAENPEPVYPTWGDWLAEIGLINWQNNGEGVYSVMVPTFKMCNPIPADIAQKLGIEPKEGA